MYKQLLQIKKQTTYGTHWREIKPTMTYPYNRSLNSLQRVITNNDMKYL